jgi:hypothetical protein
MCFSGAMNDDAELEAADAGCGRAVGIKRAVTARVIK